MIKEIETMLQEGEAESFINNRAYTIKAENMPVLLELYNLLKLIEVKPYNVVPLLVMEGYNKGKPCSYQNLLQAFKRGKDPARVVGEVTLCDVIMKFNEILKLAITKEKFEGDYPTKGKAATEFIKQAITTI